MIPVKKGRNPVSRLLSDDFFNFNLDSVFSTDTNYTTNEEGQTVIEVEVPGFNKNNLKVEIAHSILTIKGETETRKIFKQYTLKEVENVNASIKDGILSLTLIEPETKTTNIEITS